MIFITAKFRVQPQDADRWPEIVHDFTQAVRNEPGCLWFEWFRSVEDPNEYALVEAFRDDEAGAAHVQSEHFRAAVEMMRSLEISGAVACFLAPTHAAALVRRRQ